MSSKSLSGEVSAPWEHGKPPNEVLVEVKDDDGRLFRARAIWGRDGTRPHWESEDHDIKWSPEWFVVWRRI